MADYLRTEFLDRLSPSEVTFLTRTAVLDRMSGPLCDALLDATGSAEMLETLEDSNLLVIGLDRQRHWYRYHHLFRDLLLADLERREPALVTGFTASGDVVRRERTTGNGAGARATREDGALVAALVLELAQPVWASGRVDTVLRWMEWFEQAGEVEHHPDVAVHGALIFALLGRPIDAERWAAAAEGAPTDERLIDGTTMEARSRTCARCCVATASMRCGGKRKRRSPDFTPRVPTERRCSTPKGSRTSWRATQIRPSRSLRTRSTRHPMPEPHRFPL